MAVHAQVVMALQNDARFLPDLFERLKATGPGDEGWPDQVAFLQELTGLAKHLQQGHRQQLLSKLASLGLFEARGLFFDNYIKQIGCVLAEAAGQLI